MAGPVPHPRRTLDPLAFVLPAGTRLWRVHGISRDATEGSTFPRQTRFGPLLAPGGSIIPIWYGATDEEGAIFESVFHDVPILAMSPRVLVTEFSSMVLSVVDTTTDLRLVDLTSVGLRRLHVTRASLIESTSGQYATTREWAVALRDADPHAVGLTWIARQHDTSRAVMLFGDRMPPAGLEVDLMSPGPTSLAAGRGFDLVETLATRAGSRSSSDDKTVMADRAVLATPDAGDRVRVSGARSDLPQPVL